MIAFIGNECQRDAPLIPERLVSMIPWTRPAPKDNRATVLCLSGEFNHHDVARLMDVQPKAAATLLSRMHDAGLLHRRNTRTERSPAFAYWVRA